MRGRGYRLPETELVGVLEGLEEGLRKAKPAGREDVAVGILGLVLGERGERGERRGEVGEIDLRLGEMGEVGLRRNRRRLGMERVRLASLVTRVGERFAGVTGVLGA